MPENRETFEPGDLPGRVDCEAIAIMRYRRRTAGAENARRRHPFITCCLLAPLLVAAEPQGYETVVTAPPPPPDRAREDPTASTSVITTDRTVRSGESLPQLLSELPGVVITRYGSLGSLATVSMRGSAPNQVAVYADGVPLDSAVTGSVDLGLVPLTAAQRIEVYRGSSPLGQGGSALGGVLSLTSEAPERSGVSAYTGLGSFATRLGGAELAGVRGGASLVGRLAALDTAADFPYRSDNRTLFDPSDDRTLRRQNNHLRQLDGALRAALDLSPRQRLWLSVSALSRRQGLPARGTDQSYAAALDRRRLAASASFETGDLLAASGHLRATGYLLLGEQRLSDPLGEVSFVARDTRDRSLTVGATALASRPLTEWFVLAALLDARHEGFSPEERIRPDRRPPGRRERGAAALAGTVHLTAIALDVSATVRAEAARDQVSPGDLFAGGPAASAPTTDLLPIARLGLLQTPHPALRLRANFGSYARLPTLFERYGNGGVIVGNPALLPERGFSADLGGSGELSRGSAHLRIDAALFAATARDLIHFEQMGYFAGYLNVARSRSVGLELAASGRLGRWARITAQTTAMDVRDRSGVSGRDGRQLPQQPRIRAYLRPELRELSLSPSLRAGLYADAELTGGRYQDPANLVRQPARLVLGAGAHLAHRPAGLRAVLSGYNLHDARAADVLEFPLPGRSFFLTLHFSYPSVERDHQGARDDS
jgi:vitamin B12 transporter